MTLCPLSELGAVTSGRERKRHYAEGSEKSPSRQSQKGKLSGARRVVQPLTPKVFV